MGASDRLSRALAAIDAANADDPNQIELRGERRPKELAHAAMVTEWVRRLRPEASEALLLAARAHHVRRWTIARSDHPPGRRGYHRWRLALFDLHAGIAGEILREQGYDADLVERVQDLVRKRGLGSDPETQTLEDAVCLVFLETQLRDLAARLDDEKMLDVLRKTLRKMSPEAIAAAGGLPLAPEDAALLERAAAPERCAD